MSNQTKQLKLTENRKLENLKVANVFRTALMLGPTGDSRSVSNIDLCLSNIQKLQQGSQGFPVHHLRLKLI